MLRLTIIGVVGAPSARSMLAHTTSKKPHLAQHQRSSHPNIPHQPHIIALTTTDKFFVALPTTSDFRHKNTPLHTKQWGERFVSKSD
ncbi:hypothetical protein CAQU_07565 [Corynebacterium aquilae DSM 44791]|uniref:Uncharacterized protein n=1 Tax=Corynebacterium aquilae DSM 44791 TaxID=1431546 RepID=A0A1L7CGH5_9CORY|nr:hypothetical protein CAQU_07565 [Corynebacterium aquilae DSM 44791]